MITNYSACKRRNINRSLIYDEIPFSSRIEPQSPHFAERFQGSDRKKMAASRRDGSGLKGKGREQDKENINFIQARLERYEASAVSTLKQSLYSPIKQNLNNYESFTSRKSMDLPSQRAEFLSEIDSAQPLYTSRQISQKKQRKSYTAYNTNRNEYKPNLFKRPSINYQTQFQNDYCGVVEQNQKIPLLSRREYKRDPDLTITFSNASPYVTNIMSTTPKKAHPEPDQLVQKSQFLKQRLERLSRMTPKSSTRRQEQTPSITPQKTPAANQPKDPYNIVKYNKYCTQKLPLETIYDADENKHRQKTQEGEQGLQQINNLSRKISDRLRNIISRHNN